MTHGFVASIVLDLGWPLKHQDKGRELVADTGVRTLAYGGDGLPMPMDRYIVAFLLQKALESDIARFHVREIARWFGRAWRKKETIARLRRVDRCRIERPGKSGWEWLPIARRMDINEDTGEAYIEFSPECRRAAQTGTPYSGDAVRRVSRKVSVVVLYFKLLSYLAGRLQEMVDAIR